MTMARATLTFQFDDTKITRETIVDRLDAALIETFPDDVVDVHTRWVSKLEDAPLFGAGRDFRDEIIRKDADQPTFNPPDTSLHKARRAYAEDRMNAARAKSEK